MDFTKVKNALEKNEFAVKCFETKDDAVKYLKDEINEKTVGFGGSMTLLDMGLFEQLSENNTVLWHWRENSPETVKAAQTADVYISSVNGLSESGEIINIDGNCNRVSAIMFGHKKVYLVVGKNKIEETFEKAMHRARNIAAPLNSKRLSRKTPCAVRGDKCYDCNSPERICRGVSVLIKKPSCAEYEVILIDENLGY